MKKKYYHITCSKETFKRFRSAKYKELTHSGVVFVSDDDMMKNILDVFQDREVGYDRQEIEEEFC